MQVPGEQTSRLMGHVHPSKLSTGRPGLPDAPCPLQLFSANCPTLTVTPAPLCLSGHL